MAKWPTEPTGKRKTNKNSKFKLGSKAWKEHKLKLSRESNKRYREKNKLKTENKRLKIRYGITLEDYQNLYNKQLGLCKICNNPEIVRILKGRQIRSLAVDHCHDTGKVRGLLCYKCNVGLGSFNDDPKLLIRAINYLRD